MIREYKLRPGFLPAGRKSKAPISRSDKRPETKPRGRDQRGPNNANWKGGLTKNKVRYRERFQAKFPLKAEAHRQVKNALRRGELMRKPCEVCGAVNRIHAHHDDYSRPLTVRWLCQPHHLQLHAKMAKAVSQ